MELLVALVIMGIGGAAVIEAVGYARAIAIKAGYLQAANAIAQNLLEQSRARTASLERGTTVYANPEGLPSGSSVTVTVAQVPARPKLLSVKVSVTWVAGGRLGSLSGAISRETFVYVP